jgi:hypothetical protein
MITDVYISIDDLTYKKLDLFKNEPINFKQTSKDLTDITKVFLPYSLSFTIPASENNKNLVEWFGYNKTVKEISEFKFFCKIYVNHLLTFNGFLKVNTSQIDSKVTKMFNVSFASKTTDIKAILKDDTLQDLADLDINYTPKAVADLLTGGDNKLVNGVNVSYFIPFLSNLRVWNYVAPGNVAGIYDNIAYNPSTPFFDGYNQIVGLELRPAIYIKSLMNLIIKKYNLNIECPFFNTNEFNTMAMWCNEKLENDYKPKKLLITQQFNTSTTNPKAEVNNTDSSIKLTKESSTISVLYKLTLNNILSTSTNTNAKITLVKKSTNLEVLSLDFDITGNGSTNQVIQLNIPLNLFDGNEFEFYTFLTLPEGTFYTNNSSEVKYTKFNLPSGITTDTFTYTGNNTLLSSGFGKTDLFRMLPKMKVIDFITSFTKSFDIQIINNNPTTDKLYWLRKADIDSFGLEYSKNTLDYTKYVDLSNVVKSVPVKFNKFNLKHAESNYYSSKNFKKQFNKDYGQVLFPDTVVEAPNEMKIETNFCIIPPVAVIGTNDLVTAYGFTDESPYRDSVGINRYNPNHGQPTIFHKLNTSVSPYTIAIQSQDAGGNLINLATNVFNRVAPFNTNNNSLAFSNIIFNSIEFDSSLYKRYYEDNIQRLLSPNVMLNNFTFNLPASEIGINEYTKANETTLTPTGFRIQNEIIVEETLYTIIDSTIDTTTGKAKLQLLNY